MSLGPGARLGPYEVLAPLGAGGMGEVYKARDPRLGREVAIKVLPEALRTDPERLRRFEQEARAAGALNHPNVLSVLDVGSHEGVPYVVSELLEGETLRERLRVGGFTSSKAIEWGVQIARGLAAAHDKGIVHRDLKPENLFLTRDGHAKVLDFGLAKLREPRQEGEGASEPQTLTRGTEPGKVLGTVGYMSPEQVRGLPADHRSDIFSLGAVLYEMLSKRRAFAGDSAPEVLTAILKEDPPELSSSDRNVPPALARVVRRCLEKRPEDRFHSAHDLAFALEALAGLSSAQAAPAGSRRPRWLAPLAVVATLAATSAAIWLLARRDAAPAPLSYRRLTFQRGEVVSGRFGPDGQTVFYSAAWNDRPVRLFSTHIGGPEARAFDLEASIFSVSNAGELAVALLKDGWPGTLARLPIVGGTPRELLENVLSADWSPDGKTLAIVRQAGARQRIEYPIGRVLYEAGEIENPRVSPSGDRVAFVDDSGVSVVDRGGARTVLTPVNSREAFNSLAWSPSGDEVWFTDSRRFDDISLSAVTLSGRRRLLARFASPVFLEDVSRDGRALVKFHEYEERIFGVTPGGGSERELSWLQGSRAMDLSADGRFLLFHESGQGGGREGAVYLRRTDDDSPPVRLGEGLAIALSPDATWVLTRREEDHSRLWLLPVRAGEPRSLTSPGLEFSRAAPYTGSWLPDGRRVLVGAARGGEEGRSYLLDVQGGDARPVTPEGVFTRAVSPDGRLAAASDREGRILLFSIAGGEPGVVPGPPEPRGSQPLGFSADGRSLYVGELERTSASVFLRHIGTGRRTLWKKIVPADPAGLWLVEPLISLDGQAYVYTCHRGLSTLYVVEGLR